MKIDGFRGKYHFLSNFAKHPVRYDGVLWPSSEHAYQAAKTTDKDEKTAVQLAMTPGKAKSAGKKVTMRPNWDQIKNQVMLEIVRAKFKQNRNIKMKLLATGDAELIESNWWGDDFWGVFEGNGQNKLGKILMQVREELRIEGRSYEDEQQIRPEAGPQSHLPGV